MLQTLKLIAQYTYLLFVHRFLGKQLLGEKYKPPLGSIDFGDLRCLMLISIRFGYNRELPINKCYVEIF